MMEALYSSLGGGKVTLTCKASDLIAVDQINLMADLMRVTGLADAMMTTGDADFTKKFVSTYQKSMDAYVVKSKQVGR